MFKSIKALCAVVLAGAALLSTPAHAIPLTTNATVTSGNFIYTINSCQGSSCGSIGELVASGAAITIQAPGGSGNFESATGTNFADTKVTFTVQTVDGGYLNGVNLSITGSGELTSAGDTFLTTGGAAGTANISSPGGTNTTAVTSYVFTGTKSQQITIDIAAQGANGSSVKSVTQAFSVPEPASMAVLSAGVLAMAGLRRRRRQA